MKPIDQTIFGAPLGNCVQACIASIFELSLEDVPNFMERPNGEWLDSLYDFLEKYDLEPLFLEANDSFVPRGYYIIQGDTPRGIGHSCIGFAGKLVHDPHPSKVGLSIIKHIVVFVKSMKKVTG